MRTALPIQSTARTALPTLGLLALALPFAAIEAAWEAVPEVSVIGDANDNIRLRGDIEASTTRGIVEAAVTLSNFTPRGRVFIEPRVRKDSYADTEDKQLETTDTFFLAAGDFTGRLVSGGFRANYGKESVLSAELIGLPNDPDIDDPVDADTGRLGLFNEDRTRHDLGGRLDFTVSPRNTFRFEAQQTNVDYSDSVGAGIPVSFRSDFDNTTIGASVIRSVDDRNQVSARVYASQFEADRNDNQTDSVGVEGRFTRPISPTWRFELAAGVERNEYSFADDTQQRVTNANTDNTFAVRLRKRAELATLNLDFMHRLSPNGTGFIVVRDEARAYLRRQFSPRVTGTFGLRLLSMETLDAIQSNNDRDYSRLEIEFEWAMTRRWFLAAGYDHIRQEFVNEDGDASSNSVFVGVTYRGLSRQDQ